MRSALQCIRAWRVQLHQSAFPCLSRGFTSEISKLQDQERAEKSNQGQPGHELSTSGSQQASAQQQQQQQSTQDVPAWTEVVHEATGKTYYWNQKTGQTTAVDDPHPHGWRQGGGGSGHNASSKDSGYVDPRAEAPIEDKTGTYAAIGAGLGVFLGWASQFF